MELLQWQKDMKDKLNKNGYLMLSADTGIGKSVLSREILSKTLSGLIITPPHLLLECYYEFVKMGITPCIIKGKDQIITESGIYLIATSHMALYGVTVKCDLGVIVCDELHRWKSHVTKLWKNTMKIVKQFKYKIGITATMTPKNSNDFATMLLLLVDETRLKYRGSYYKFAEENVRFKKQWFGTRSIDIAVGLHEFALQKVQQENLTVMTYEKAGLEVPVMTENDVYFDVTSMYNKKMVEVSVENSEDMDINEFGYRHSDFCQLSNCFVYKDKDTEGVVKKYAMKEKIEALKSVIEGEENKGVVFYWYKESLIELKANLKVCDYMEYVSGMDIEIFAKSKAQILLANYKSMGEGMRVKCADWVVKFDLIYDAGLIIQSEGRLRYVGRPTPYKIFTLIPNNDKVMRILNNIKTKKNKMFKISKGAI